MGIHGMTDTETKEIEEYKRIGDIIINSLLSVIVVFFIAIIVLFYSIEIKDKRIERLKYDKVVLEYRLEAYTE